MEPSIIYEDNHLLALNKPAGMLVQGDSTGDSTIIDWGKNWLKVKYEKPGAVFLTPAHRLDRPVSGALLMAKTDKSLTRMNALFADRKVQKIYWALVLNKPQQMEARLEQFLWKDKGRLVSEVYNQKPKHRPEAKEVILEYKFLKKAGDFYMLEVHPLTGRSHQIRAQLASIGCPIVGDLKYGAKTPLPDASIALHCRSMEFLHPVKLELLKIEAETNRRIEGIDFVF